MKTWLHDFIDLLYPNACEACQQPLAQSEHVLCTACLLALPTDINAVSLSNKLLLENVALHSMLSFAKEGMVQDLMHGLKYKNRPDIGGFFGNLLGKSTLGISGTVDALVYVPMFAAKQKQRGYNQAELIAQGIAEVWQKPIIDNAIIKTKATYSQTGMSRQDRYKNMLTVFELSKPEVLAGKHICVVDDVLTTGATLEAMCKLLENAQVTKLSVLTVAAAI
jgi:ComF family protein